LLYLNKSFGVSLLIGGKGFPLTNLTFNTISIYENTSNSLPTVEIVLRDVNQSLYDAFELGDGTSIELVIENNGIRDGMRFDLTGYRGDPSNKEVLLCGILSYPKFLQVSTLSFKGTASDALHAIGADCGIQRFKITPTMDSQVWLPSLSTGIARCADITAASYKNGSFFRFAITALGELILVDVNSQITNKALQLTVDNSTTGAYLVTSWNPESMNGVLNNWKGYGFKVTTVGLDKTPKVISTTSVRKMSSFLNLSKTFGQAGYSTMDNGNTHINYETALQSNKRNLALYNVNSHVLLRDCIPDVGLLAPVDLFCGTRHSGRYLITARTRVISGSSYYEKLELCTNGYATDKNRRLI